MSLFKTLVHLYHPHRSNNHRARVLHPEAIGILSLLVVTFATTLSALHTISPRFGEVLGFASSITPTQVIEQTNQRRAEQGLAPLVVNDRLAQAALAKGQDMFANQYWAHTSPAGLTPWKFIQDAGYTYQVAGENLARDFGDTSSMVDAWMASPTHRANIMNGRYQEIGIAVIDGTLEGYETTLVVQMFGLPKSPIAVAAETESGITRGVTTQTITLETVASPVPAVSSPIPTSPPSIEDVVPTEQVQIAPVGPQRAVLASTLVPQGSLNVPPLLTPLQLTKAVFLGLILMIVSTLVYDSFIIGNRSVMRLVGKNLAHVLLFMIVAFLLISFKGGILG